MDTCASRRHIEAIAAALSTAYGRPVSEAEISPVGNAAFQAEIADATSKYRVPLPDGGAGFLIVSGDGNPQLVQRAVTNIQVARELVSAETAAPILQPAATGTMNGATFAIWPECRPFDSGGRIRQRILRFRYRGPVIGWSKALVLETLKPGDPATFIADLRIIMDDDALPDTMRREASAAAERIDTGNWQPSHCLHHGDFWTGNLVFPQSADGPRFHVVDWAGMLRDGYPFLDLSRMLMSLRCPTPTCRRQVDDLRRQVGCRRQDVTAYVLSAIGHIGGNLEHFPVDRYRTMAVRLFTFIDRL